jgi:glucose/arabinose dehydrogenase
MRASLLLCASLAACGGDDGPSITPPVPDCTPVDGEPDLELQEVGTGFGMPVYVGAPPGDTRLFVVEKSGAIRVIDDGVLLPEPFLEVNVPGSLSLDDERGLLGLAFAPDYPSSHHLFVFYTNPDGDEVIERYTEDAANPNRADPATAQVVFTLADFASNHNGGSVQFGPDGYLYIGFGDGGGADDPMDYGQNLEVAFGKMLRIDVSELPYSIPADNPFADGGGLAEIWSYGWRNPFRFSFDRMTGDLYVGDVGQGAWEEVDVEPRGASGRNYGWNDMEGEHCFDPQSGCAMSDRVLPVYEQSHNDSACSVIGGYVYRGTCMPGYQGHYFFTDYCESTVRSFRWDGAGGRTDDRTWPNLSGGEPVSFGEDASGELYMVRQATGQIARIVARAP